MNERELLERLNSLDTPVEPSEAFRADLLERLKRERLGRQDGSRMVTAPEDARPHEPDVLWATPAPRRRRVAPVWAVAVFLVVLLAGGMTWWLGPGAQDRAPTVAEPGPSPTRPPGETLSTEKNSAPVIAMPPPGSDDYGTLQLAIDENPGAVLQLQPGTYDLRGETLSLPHGVTLRGASRDSEVPQTTVSGQVQIVALGPEHSDEEVTLSAIEMESAESEFVVLYGRHGSGDAPSEGAKLTIEDAYIRADAVVAAVDLHARGIEVTIISSVVVSNQGFAIYAFDRGGSTIEVSDSRVDFANYGIVVTGDNSRPGTTSTVRVVDNHLRAGRLPPDDVFSASVAGMSISRTEDLTIRGNTVEIPYGSSDPDDPAVGIAIDGNGPRRTAKVTDNRLIGGDRAEETALRVGLHVMSRNATYSRNTLEGSWTTGVMVYTSGNVFDDNSLRRMNLTSAAEEPGLRNTLPPVHWWLGAGANENTITDNTFEELLIIDRGDENSYPEFFELVEP